MYLSLVNWFQIRLLRKVQQIKSKIAWEIICHVLELKRDLQSLENDPLLQNNWCRYFHFQLQCLDNFQVNIFFFVSSHLLSLIFITANLSPPPALTASLTCSTEQGSETPRRAREGGEQKSLQSCHWSTLQYQLQLNQQYRSTAQCSYCHCVITDICFCYQLLVTSRR